MGDALALDWDGLFVRAASSEGVLWCYPPFSQIENALLKFSRCRAAHLMLIVPVDRSATWFPVLHGAMCSESCIFIEHDKDNILPQSGIPQERPPTFQWAAIWLRPGDVKLYH